QPAAIGPAGGYGPAGGGAGKLGYDPFPAAVLCEILHSGVRQGSGGMVRTQHRAPALPHPGAGPAA
ncbi:Copper chaperone, partial [Dysosmobacter welbionis]